MTIDANFLRNYLRANRVGAEDDVVMLNMMSSGDPILFSKTEPRGYPAASEYCTESAFVHDCLAARMMGAWDAEVGRPMPEMAGEAYRGAYARMRDRLAAGEV